MNTLNIKLYDFVKQELKLSDAKALEFVKILDETVQEDIRSSSVEYRSIIKEDLFKLETGLRKDMSGLEIGLVKEIKDSKVDMIKWMAGFFIALALMIIGIYLKK